MTGADAVSRRTIGWRACLSVLLAAWLFALQDGAVESLTIGAICLVVAGTLRASAIALRGVAALSIIAGIAWLVPAVLAPLSNLSVIQASATAVAPLRLLALLALVLASVPGLRTVSRAWLAALGIACLLAGVAVILTWDPLLVLDCAPNCGHVDPIITVAGADHATINRALLVAGIATGGSLVLAGVRAAFARPRVPDHALIAAGGALVGLVAVIVAIDGLSRSLTASTLAVYVWQPLVERAGVVELTGMAMAATGVALPAARIALTERRLGALTAAIARAEDRGGVSAAFARALGDPSVRILYPVPNDADLMDADGRTVTAPVPGTRMTPLERGGRPLAVIVHREAVDPTTLLSGLGPGSLVALDNERLRADLLRELEAVRSSRRRIVELGDTERRRIERDLHDGAQQRLLAVAMELRIEAGEVASAGDPGRSARLAEAQVLAVGAVEQLRRIARGIYPAILTQAGLGPALRSLADETAGAIELDIAPATRAPAAIEAVTYAVVAELADELCRDGAGMDVRIEQRAASLRLEAVAERAAPDPCIERLRDRIGAANGEMRTDTSVGGGLLLQAELPCA